MQTVISGGWESLSPIVAKDVLFNEDFDSEMSLCDWIELNIEAFCEDQFGVKLESYEREYRIAANIGGRIDFVIRDVEDKHIIVECKAPKYKSSPDQEIPKAIGQILSYKVQLNNRGLSVDRMAIVSTVYSPTLVQILEMYNLPTEFYVVDKTKTLKACLLPKAINTH